MRLAEVFQRAVGGGASVRFSAYDGSHAGPADAGVSIEVRTPEALSYLASAPGELGLARAYVTGHLEIIGDVYGALKHLSEISLREVPWGERVELLVGRATRAMWVMTFHSACVRMLRADAHRLGYTRQFTIYDAADSRRLIKKCLDDLDIDPTNMITVEEARQVFALHAERRKAVDGVAHQAEVARIGGGRHEAGLSSPRNDSLNARMHDRATAAEVTWYLNGVAQTPLAFAASETPGTPAGLITGFSLRFTGQIGVGASGGASFTIDTTTALVPSTTISPVGPISTPAASRPPASACTPRPAPTRTTCSTSSAAAATTPTSPRCWAGGSSPPQPPVAPGPGAAASPMSRSRTASCARAASPRRAASPAPGAPRPRLD